MTARSGSWLFAVALGLGLGLALPAAAQAPDQKLSVLTYNVHGLPWPLASGRDAAFARIEARLRALRHEGLQPHIIVLQEAFTTGAKRIGHRSGYRYVVEGPMRTAINDGPMTPADAHFAAGARFWKGETIPKLVDSGLQILSDYPIISVRRIAFPRFACAGFDCLANKGMLLATIAVPNLPGPLTIVTAHLNSRHASGVSSERSFAAYRRQLAYMDDFLRTNRDPKSPMIVAGDLNPSGAERRRYLADHVAAHWTPTPTRRPPDALDACLDAAGFCGRPLSSADIRQLRREKDRQFYFGGSARLIADRLFVPFHREADGTMLSDHIGYGIVYGLRWISTSQLAMQLGPRRQKRV
jgi:endonuclease/exonuclease/phosphatase family metal-dependent hydrolase